MHCGILPSKAYADAGLVYLVRGCDGHWVLTDFHHQRLFVDEWSNRIDGFRSGQFQWLLFFSPTFSVQWSFRITFCGTGIGREVVVVVHDSL